MRTISIGDRKIGPGEPSFIIAEAGVNHNGKLDLAMELVEAAAQSGADAVKFQTFKAEKLVTGSAKMADYQVKNTGKSTSQYEMLKKLELSYEFHRELKAYAEEKGLIFMSTPFDDESLEFLFELGIQTFKAGSGDLTNLPFLEKIAQKELPVIISTGMADLTESKEAVEAILATGNSDLIVLHCTTNYPCPLEEVNLSAMQTLATELDVMVGYSDHTVGILVPQLAVAAGARVIEKHFTLNKQMDGPDHQASLEPDELKEMVDRIRIVEQIMGTGEKVPNPSELKIKEAARKSIAAVQFIPEGAILSEVMFTIKRPGTGLPPKRLKELIGKKAMRDIAMDELIQEHDFE